MDLDIAVNLSHSFIVSLINNSFTYIIVCLIARSVRRDETVKPWQTTARLVFGATLLNASHNSTSICVKYIILGN